MFHYEVRYYDEIDGENTVDEGIVYGQDIDEAAKEVKFYYGRVNVITVSLTPLEDEKVMSLSAIKEEFKMEG